MTERPLRETIPGLPAEHGTPYAEARTAGARPPLTDLHWFFDAGAPLERRRAPARTLALARALFERLSGAADEGAAAGLGERIVTDELLRSEADRDQNV